MMEALHQGYRDIMAMPVGRRKRIVMEKEHLDTVRRKRQEAKNKGKWR